MYLNNIFYLEMFKYLRKEKEQTEAYENVIEGLKNIYRAKLLPLEQAYKFHEFHSPPLDDSDFDSKPMVLLVGQVSSLLIISFSLSPRPQAIDCYFN
jgi:hypothetical protein